MTRIWIVLVLAAVLAVGAASTPSTAAADTTTPLVVTDPAGDSATAADITTITLTPGTGTVSLDVTYTGQLGSDGSFIVLIDSDRNQQTGKSGFEYLIYANAAGVSLDKADGSSWVQFSHQPLQPALTATDMTCTITLADLGGVTAFDFVGGSARGNDIDVAPDSGVATYGAEPAQEPAAPTVKSVMLPAVVLLPTAGKVLRVPRLQLTLTDDSIVRADSQTCTLTFKGKKLPALAGGCAWKIPKAYKKKHLILKITVTYGAESHLVTWPVTPS